MLLKVPGVVVLQCRLSKAALEGGPQAQVRPGGEAERGDGSGDGSGDGDGGGVGRYVAGHRHSTPEVPSLHTGLEAVNDTSSVAEVTPQYPHLVELLQMHALEYPVEHLELVSMAALALNRRFPPLLV